MNLASIDIGTNSTRMLVCSYNDSNLKIIERKMVITRLGKGISRSGNIQENSFNLTLEVLKDYAKILENCHVEKYRAVGTSALRRAINSNTFLEEAAIKTGLNIEIINAEQEAFLSFFGAVKGLSSVNKKELPENRYMVIDSGGGSSEIIYGDLKGRVINSKSLDIGCVRTSEQFLFLDPPSEKEIKSMHSFIKKEISASLSDFNVKTGNAIAIGLAGTMSSLASIYLALENYDSERINSLVLSIYKLSRIYEDLKKLNLEQRKKIKGLEPERADIILGGTAIIIEIMKYFKFKNIIVSQYDILDGIIYSLIDF